MNVSIKKVLASTAAIAALALPQLAFGQTGSLTMSGYAFPSGLNFNVTGRGTVGAGGFNASFAAPPAPTSFVAYCVDLAESFSFNNAFTVTATSAASLFGAVRTSVLDRLYTQHFAAANTQVMSSAFQLAVWEVIQDAENTTFGTNSLGSGSFMATGATSGTLDNDAITLANFWLNTLTGASGGYNLTVLASGTHQDQMMATPVPEPETYMMLLAGLGLMGFVARRRRQGAAA